VVSGKFPRVGGGDGLISKKPSVGGWIHEKSLNFESSKIVLGFTIS